MIQEFLVVANINLRIGGTILGVVTFFVDL